MSRSIVCDDILSHPAEALFTLKRLFKQVEKTLASKAIWNGLIIIKLNNDVINETVVTIGLDRTNSMIWWSEVNLKRFNQTHRHW